MSEERDVRENTTYRRYSHPSWSVSASIDDNDIMTLDYLGDLYGCLDQCAPLIGRQKLIDFALWALGIVGVPHRETRDFQRSGRQVARV